MKPKQLIKHWNKGAILGVGIALLVYSQCENIDLTPLPRLGSGENSDLFPIVTLLQETEPKSDTQSILPRFSHHFGVYNAEIQVRIEPSAEGWTFYTLDGSDPTPKSTVYTEPIVLSQTSGFITIKALSIKPGSKPSPIATAYYKVDLDPTLPSFQPETSSSITNPLPPVTR